MDKRYYQLMIDGCRAVIDIYGDITSWPWLESDVSSYTLSKELAELGPEVTEIVVNINSYGGEVAEGLAIYNSLRRHNAKVVTYVDGFACSIASVIFMAGDERHMADASLLMVHNAWTWGSGNASELRKLADDMDVITEASKAAYLSRVSIDAEALQVLLDAETWIAPEDALSMGFATHLDGATASGTFEQSGRSAVFEAIRASALMAAEQKVDDPGDGEDPDDLNAADDPDDAGDTDADLDDSGDAGDADDPDECDSGDGDGTDDKSKQSEALASFFLKLEI